MDKRMLITLLDRVRDYVRKYPERKILLILLLLGLLRGIVFAGVTPAYQAPDEPTHAGFIEVVALQHRVPEPDEKLPSIVHDSLERSRWWDEWRAYSLYRGPQELGIAAAGHPPLYYLLTAVLFLLFYRFGDIWIFVIRLFGALLGTGVVLFAFETTRLIFPRDRVMIILVPTLIVFQPQFGFISSSISNDSLVVLLSSMLIYLLIRFQTAKSSYWLSFLIGLVLGAGLLTKVSLVIFVPIILIFFAALALLKRLSLFGSIKHLLIIGVTTLVVSGWWYVGRYLATGGIVSNPPPIGPPINKSFLALLITKSFAGKMFQTFWANFGGLMIPIGKPGYMILAGATLAALVGYLVFAVGYVIGKTKIMFDQLFSLVGFAGVSIITYLSIAQFEIMSQGGAQGRYLFIAIVPLFILFVFGLRQFFPQKLEKGAVVAISFAAFMFFFLSVAYYIMPFYYG